MMLMMMIMLILMMLMIMMMMMLMMMMMMMMRRPSSLRVRAKPRHLPYIYIFASCMSKFGERPKTCQKPGENMCFTSTWLGFMDVPFVNSWLTHS